MTELKQSGTMASKKARPKNRKARGVRPTPGVAAQESDESESVESLRKVPAAPEKAQFLTAFGLLDTDFQKVGITWEELCLIAEAHLREFVELETTAEYIASRIRRHPAVHSVKARVKDPAHLLEKILRKRRENRRRRITAKNYTEEITDLIGIRILHLFKGEWLPIHRFIIGAWDLDETPIAYLRRGDPKEVEDVFRSHGCEVREHQMGYRSVHYLIRSKPAKQVRVAELQVRTIFEEGWSEIDHRIRYPYKLDNEVLGQFLGVFNGLAGSADEMGTFIQRLRDQLDAWEAARTTDRIASAKAVDALNGEIAKLKIDANEKKKLEKRVKELEESTPRATGVTLGDMATVFNPGNIFTITGLPMNPILASSVTSLPLASTGTISILPRKCAKCGGDIPWTAVTSSPYCGKCLGHGIL